MKTVHAARLLALALACFGAAAQAEDENCDLPLTPETIAAAEIGPAPSDVQAKIEAYIRAIPGNEKAQVKLLPFSQRGNEMGVCPFRFAWLQGAEVSAGKGKSPARETLVYFRDDAVVGHFFLPAKPMDPTLSIKEGKCSETPDAARLDSADIGPEPDNVVASVRAYVRDKSGADTSPAHLQAVGKPRRWIAPGVCPQQPVWEQHVALSGLNAGGKQQTLVMLANFSKGQVTGLYTAPRVLNPKPCNTLMPSAKLDLMDIGPPPEQVEALVRLYLANEGFSNTDKATVEYDVDKVTKSWSCDTGPVWHTRTRVYRVNDQGKRMSWQPWFFKWRHNLIYAHLTEDRP